MCFMDLEKLFHHGPAGTVYGALWEWDCVSVKGHSVLTQSVKGSDG